MNKAWLDQSWDQFRQKYGIYIRVLEAIPAGHYESHPVAGWRTPAELAVHVSGSIVRDVAEGVAKGRITADEASEAAVTASLGGKEGVLDFARECFQRADAAVAGIGDAQLSAMVPTPWNMTFPGWVGFELMRDELVHHRGQLYAYARLCGVQPPFMYGFAENAPEFRPRAAAEAGGG